MRLKCKEHEEALDGDDVGGLGEGPVEFYDGVLDQGEPVDGFYACAREEHGKGEEGDV